MVYEFNKHKIITQLKQQGYTDPLHEVDWDSYPKDISIEEWLNNEYGIILKTLKTEVENIKALEEKEKYEQEKKIKEEERKLLTEWENSKSEKINISSFEIPQHYVKMVCNGFSYGCFLVGEGGIGKSYMTINTIKELNKDFAYLNTSITPLSLYKFLYNNKDKLILLDDVQGIFQDEKSISILKSALWDVNNKRVVCWETTSDKIGNAPFMFEFTGQIIILANKLNTKDLNLSALISRVNYQKIEFSYQEKITIMKAIVRKPYKDLKVDDRLNILNKLISKTDDTDKCFNFRTLIKAYNFYLYDKNKFDVLLDSVLEKDKELELIKKLTKTNFEINKQIQIFKELTGKSRATYFNKKKNLSKSLNEKQYSFLNEVGINEN